MASDAQSPVIMAASSGDVDQLARLLQNEETPSDKTVQNLLITAVKGSHLPVISFLLFKFPSTPLDEEVVRPASSTGSIPIFSALLERDPSIINMEFDHQGTPLARACMHRTHIDFLRYLLEAGADPNQDPDVLLYPLAWVTGFYTDPAAIDLLLKHGARIDGTDSLGTAAQRGNLPMMLYLLEKGADPNKDVGALGWRQSPLHRAVAGNQVKAAEILLDRGADVTATDKNNNTALQYAQEKERTGADVSEMMRLLEAKMA